MISESCRERSVESEDGEEVGKSRCGWTFVAQFLFLFYFRIPWSIPLLETFSLWTSQAKPQS